MTRPAPPATYIALLRGINVGGINSLPMRSSVDLKPASERATIVKRMG